MVGQHRTFGPPQDGAREHVFEHRLREPDADSASITVANPDHAPTGGIAVTVSWDPRELPRLWQWRMLRIGHVRDRARARQLRPRWACRGARRPARSACWSPAPRIAVA